MCEICDTFGASGQEHTYKGSCLLSPYNKVMRDAEMILAAIHDLGGPRDKIARQILREHMTEDGQLVVSNRSLVAEMLEVQ